LLFFPFITAATDIAIVRHSGNGERLSAEMALFVALVAFDDYLLFPNAEERSARMPGATRDPAPSGKRGSRRRSGGRAGEVRG